MDYEPYLLGVGAAEGQIFATNAYCPITNLDNADTAYEWMFYGVNSYYFLGGGTMSGEQLVVSEELKDLLMLATKLMNTGHDVDYAVPWGQGHGGNYDLDELFAWIAKITK